MVRKTLAERTHKRSVVLASEATSLEWFLLIKFLELPDIIEHGGLTTEHESMLIHNVMRVLFDIVGVSGHPKVTSAQSGAAKRMPTREMEPKDERVIHAYGSCLADIVVAPCVDWNRTTSNDVCEVLSVLGIEACAHVLFEQIKSVVSFDGTYVDDRHVAVIVETMTRGGALMSLTRHGFNREATSPLMRCSFEETTDVLYQAALNADCENARCVSTSIMLGQTAHFGTGSVKVMFRRKGGCATQSKPRRRVLRSTRRSFRRSRSADGRVRHRQRQARRPEDRGVRPQPGADCPASTQAAALQAVVAVALTFFFSCVCVCVWVKSIAEYTKLPQRV